MLGHFYIMQLTLSPCEHYDLYAPDDAELGLLSCQGFSLLLLFPILLIPNITIDSQVVTKNVY